MEIITSIVSAFFRSFGLLAALIEDGINAVTNGILDPLMHAGLPRPAALIIVAAVPVACLIAAWRGLRGKTRLVVSALLVVALLSVIGPPVVASLQ
jgi:hypothetical protein